jgi:hypothetical protein
LESTEANIYELVLPALLVAQGVMGAIDTLLNHEFLEGLPHRRGARGELRLHALREALYATLFLGFAWFAWLGALAPVLGVLLAAEALVMLSDEVLENRTRVLPQNERALHVLLTINFGAIAALLVPILAEWWTRPTALAPAHHGWASWALTALAAAALAWAVRDGLAVRRLKPLN